MLDIHSHVLPNMDDGSSSSEESLNILEALRAQGVDKAVFTPHFYADEEYVSDFLKRRQIAFDSLRPYLKNDFGIILGAEVNLSKYLFSTSNIGQLHALKMGDSDRILLEIPYYDLPASTVYEWAHNFVCEGLRPIIAHIERHRYIKGYDKLLDSLYADGCRFQCNAMHIIERDSYRFIKAKLQAGMVDYIASDVHNMTTRPPLLTQAYDKLTEDFSPAFISDLRSREL